MTKTDFKNIYEAFMHCDTNKLKKEFAAMGAVDTATEGKIRHALAALTD